MLLALFLARSSMEYPFGAGVLSGGWRAWLNTRGERCVRVGGGTKRALHLWRERPKRQVGLQQLRGPIFLLEQLTQRAELSFQLGDA
jgi:hypothetical protein